MKLFLAACSALFFMTSVALSHSWYDPDCCGGNDCEPVRPVNKQGQTFVTTKDGRTWVVPDHVTTRPSKDDDYHVCIYQEKVWCWYVPTGV